MKSPLVLLVTVAACAVAAQTAIPRLDGQWTLDPTKTPGYVARSGVPDLTLTVQQTDTEILFEFKSQAKRVTRYRIGEKTVETVGGQQTTAFATWQGGRLVITGERANPDGIAIPYRLVISLPDANELVMEERQSPPNTDFVSKRVFTRVE
jgi:hypothetical protein